MLPFLVTCSRDIVPTYLWFRLWQCTVGPLQDPVTWYGINYSGTQMTQWEFQNKGKSGWTCKNSFVLDLLLLRSGLKASITCSTLSWSSNIKVTVCLTGKQSNASYWPRMTTKNRLRFGCFGSCHLHSNTGARTSCIHNCWSRSTGCKGKLVLIVLRQGPFNQFLSEIRLDFRRCLSSWALLSYSGL